MRWDRKLAVFSVIALVIVVLAAACVIRWTVAGINSSGERISGRAEEGFADLMERVSDPENVGHTIIARRGKYDDQEIYEDFDEAWLTEMVLDGHGFMEEDIKYTHAVKFRLRTYDTENIYEWYDTRMMYGRYTDEAVLYKDGDVYYAVYLDGGVEYRFIVRCDPLTEWLEGGSIK